MHPHAPKVGEICLDVRNQAIRYISAQRMACNEMPHRSAARPPRFALQQLGYTSAANAKRARRRFDFNFALVLAAR
jgi:hypothetical protein